MSGETPAPPADLGQPKKKLVWLVDVLTNGLTGGGEGEAWTLGTAILSDAVTELRGLHGLVALIHPDLPAADLEPLLAGLARRLRAALEVLRTEQEEARAITSSGA